MTTVSNTTPLNATPAQIASSDNPVEIMLAVGLANMQVYDQTLANYGAQVQEDNYQLGNYNNAMSAVQSDANNTGSETLSSTSPMMNYTNPEGQTSQIPVLTFLNANDIPLPCGPTGGDLNQNDWQTILTNLKNSSDSLSSTSQLAQMQLQAILNVVQQNDTEMSQMLKGFDQLGMTIIQNTQ
jgi:hypothetical protein